MKTLQLLALYCWLKLQAFEWRRGRRSVRDRFAHRRNVKRNTIEAKSNTRSLTKEEKDFALLVGLVVGLLFLHNIIKSSRNQSSKGVVPPSAERLLSSLLSEEQSECLIGDLHEEYEMLKEEIGPVRAKLWVYMQVCESAWPLAREAAKAKLSYWLGQITQ